MMWRRRGTRAGEGAGGEGEEEEAYRRRRGPSPLATPSGRPRLWRSGGRPEQREARLWKKGNASWRGHRREGEEEEAYSRRRPLSPLAAARPVAASREERRGSWLLHRRSRGGEWGIGKEKTNRYCVTSGKSG